MSIYSALKNNAVEDAEDKPTFLSLKPLYLSTPVNVVSYLYYKYRNFCAPIFSL